LPSSTLKLSASAGCYLEAVPALQGARSPLRPAGFFVYASLICCSRVTSLRNESNTQYGWVASPYPTGTFTPQDTPSFVPARLWRRDAGYPAPPPQTRTCSFPASGSSVVLAFARTFTVTRYKVQWLFPSGRLARVVPVRQCPARVSFEGSVLPWGPSPCGRFSRPPTTMPHKTPRGIRLLRACLTTPCSETPPGFTPFQSSSPHLCPKSRGVVSSLQPGAFGASRVL